MPTLLRHASWYSVGSVLTMLASIVSFPVLTRLLSVDEYGMLNTIALTLTLLVALGKLGMQRATVRFYHEEVRRTGSADGIAATLVYGMSGIGIVTTLLCVAALLCLPEAGPLAAATKQLMLIACWLIAIRVADSAFGNLMYAQERSAALAIVNTGKRYLVLAIVLAVLLGIAADAAHFFAATIAAEVLGLIAIAWAARRNAAFHPSAVDASLFLRMAAFGVPMVGVEMAWSMLAVGDRYVIQHLLGAESVGIYSAAYNLCEYVKTATIVALANAVLPVFQRMWDNEGRQATEHFLARYGRAYMAGALLIASLVSVNAEPLITLAASAKYASGTVIVPWVMMGMVLESYVGIATAGLMLKKRSSALLGLVVIATVLNIALNYLLIPWLGLVGAAIATLLAFGFLMVSAMVRGRAELQVAFPWRIFLFGTGAFVVTWWAGIHIETAWPLLDLVCRTAFALPVFCTAVWFADPHLRDDAMRFYPAIRRRLGWGGAG